MDYQVGKTVNQFATASRWRMRIKKFITWTLIIFFIVGFFLLYAWWQQHGVNRINLSLPNDTVFYLSASQESLISEKDLFDNQIWNPLMQQLVNEGYDFKNLGGNIKYGAFVLTNKQGTISRHLFLQCATFNCANELLKKYPNKAQQVDVLIVVISFDEILDLDNQKNWTQKLPKQLQYSDFGLFVDFKLVEDLVKEKNISISDFNINSDIFLAINKQDNYFNFELLSSSYSDNLKLSNFVYPLSEKSVLSFGGVTLNDLNLDNEQKSNIEQLSLSWQKLFGQDFYNELSVFFNEPLSVQLIFNNEVDQYEPIFIFSNNQENLFAFKELIPRWLAQQFPTKKEKVLPDGTVAINLVSQPNDWQWQQDADDDRLMIIDKEDGSNFFAYSSIGDYLVISNSSFAIKQVLDSNWSDSAWYYDQCQVGAASIISFKRHDQINSWLKLIPEFILVTKEENQRTIGCIFSNN